MTSIRRVTAGPYTLELPANGVAILYESDKGGNEHQLPGGVGYLEALVQFAGEIVRLQAFIKSQGDELATEREITANLGWAVERLNGDREKVAALMLRNGIATGHGDTIDDLLGELEAWLKRFHDHDLAIRDAISETARIADELAFWKFQAIWHRAMMLYGKPAPGRTPLLLDSSPVWKEAERQLEDYRAEENRERVVRLS